MMCLVSSLNLKNLCMFIIWQFTDKENWFINTHCSTHLRGQPGSLYYNIPTSVGQYETCGKEKKHPLFPTTVKRGQNLRFDLNSERWNYWREILNVVSAWTIETGCRCYFSYVPFISIMLISKAAEHQF